jgi:inosose dehydratase
VSSLLDRVAGAPITWGVCEVPGWGLQLGHERVLREMADIGLRATERGPDGFLPSEPGALRGCLDEHGLELAGGFVPAVLHIQDRLDEELAAVRRAADLLAASGSPVLVLAAETGEEGYEGSAELGEAEWATLVQAIDRVIELGDDLGLTVALHPHRGTVIEGPAHVEELMERSPISLCLDTGHLMAGGADPGRIARSAPERIGHVHLKDVDADLAAQVRDRRIGYHEAVTRGVFRPLGAGDAGIGGIVAGLERAGYRGWYVVEQDTVLTNEPEEGAGPRRDAVLSMEFLRRVASDLHGGTEPGRPGRGGRSHEASPRSREEVGR